MSISATESKRFTSISATTVAFTCWGGRYGVAVVATWGGGSVEFDILGPDQTTWLATGLTFSANGYNTVDIPPGQYRFAIATATGVYISATSIPF